MFIWKELDALDHIYGGRVNDQPRDKCMLQVHKATLIGLETFSGEKFRFCVFSGTFNLRLERLQT